VNLFLPTEKSTQIRCTGEHISHYLWAFSTSDWGRNYGETFKRKAAFLYINNVQKIFDTKIVGLNEICISVMY
jgi:hypothetical protein